MIYFPEEATKVVLVLRKRRRDSKGKGMLIGSLCKRNMSPWGQRGNLLAHLNDRLSNCYLEDHRGLVPEKGTGDIALGVVTGQVKDGCGKQWAVRTEGGAQTDRVLVG